MIEELQKTFFDYSLTDDLSYLPAVTKEQAEELFQFFSDCTLFRWKDVNNDCEDRANALCMLLDSWHLPNCKAWVFSGFFLNKGWGSLSNFWNYHVAAAIPVMEESGVVYYVLDPATLNRLHTVFHWADGITAEAYSYHLIKHGNYYIFPPGKIYKDNWFRRNRQNYKWTIQGLSGINGVSKTGKAQVCFNKNRILKTEKVFNDFKRNKPFLPSFQINVFQ